MSRYDRPDSYEPLPSYGWELPMDTATTFTVWWTGGRPGLFVFNWGWGFDNNMTFEHYLKEMARRGVGPKEATAFIVRNTMLAAGFKRAIQICLSAVQRTGDLQDVIVYSNDWTAATQALENWLDSF